MAQIFLKQRQKKLLKPFIKNLTKIINPPVDKSYFLDKIDIKKKKIKISFWAGLDKRKG